MTDYKHNTLRCGHAPGDQKAGGAVPVGGASQAIAGSKPAAVAPEGRGLLP